MSGSQNAERFGSKYWAKERPIVAAASRAGLHVEELMYIAAFVARSTRFCTYTGLSLDDWGLSG